MLKIRFRSRRKEALVNEKSFECNFEQFFLNLIFFDFSQKKSIFVGEIVFREIWPIYARSTTSLPFFLDLAKKVFCLKIFLLRIQEMLIFYSHTRNLELFRGEDLPS